MAMDAAQLALEYFEETESPQVGRIGEKHSYSLDEIKSVELLPRPVSIRDRTALPQHSMNMWAAKQLPRGLPILWYETPSHYRTSLTVVIGPDDPILWPSYTERLDYEIEVAV